MVTDIYSLSCLLKPFSSNYVSVQGCLPIAQVSLLLLPSVDDFEDHLLTTLCDDLTCEGSGVDGSSPITIEERRLKVVLYNGWTLVGSPVIGYLDKVSPSSGKTTGSFRGSTYGLRSNLILKVSIPTTQD